MVFTAGVPEKWSSFLLEILLPICYIENILRTLYWIYHFQRRWSLWAELDAAAVPAGAVVASVEEAEGAVASAGVGAAEEAEGPFLAEE